MSSPKLEAGHPFPKLVVSGADGVQRDLSQPTGGHDWMMVVVYRGRHCPMCTRYLNELETYRAALGDIGVDVAAVSADSAEQLAEHTTQLSVGFPLYHGLSISQMQQLGLYVSDPRSASETDHPFAEPGLFVINADGALHVVDISNNPFVRPALKTLVSGLKWIRDPANNYPVRGTRSYVA